MIEHLKIVSVFANLAVAIGAAAYAWRVSRRYAEPYLAPFFCYTVLFNACFLTLLVAAQSRIDPAAALFAGRDALARQIERLGVTLVEIGLVAAMAAVLFGFRGRRLTRRFFSGVGIAALAVVLAYAPAIASPPAPDSAGWLERARALLYNNLILLEIPLLAALLIDPEGLRSGGRRRIARAFGSLYIARFPIAVALLYAFAIARPSEMARFAIGHAVLLFFNLMPILWLGGWFAPYMRSEGARQP